uniref:Uncharacterized protein n=1 Tax=Salix viminalis TaxID=40686 RepID=A0A6N2L4G5_SALVM
MIGLEDSSIRNRIQAPGSTSDEKFIAWLEGVVLRGYNGGPRKQGGGQELTGLILLLVPSDTSNFNYPKSQLNQKIPRHVMYSHISHLSVRLVSIAARHHMTGFGPKKGLNHWIIGSTCKSPGQHWPN